MIHKFHGRALEYVFHELSCATKVYFGHFVTPYRGVYECCNTDMQSFLGAINIAQGIGSMS